MSLSQVSRCLSCQHGHALEVLLPHLAGVVVERAACTQAELDQWLAGNSSHLARSANFVRWAVARRHASRLTAPASRWTGPAGAA